MNDQHMPFNPQTMDAVELHPAICGLIWSLPWWNNGDWETTREWTVEERDLWIKAFIAVTDLILLAEKPGEKLPKEKPPTVVAETPKKEKPKPIVLDPPQLPEIPSFTETAPAIAQPEKFVEVAPYRGSKNAASIIWETIQNAGKRASVWLNKEGRVRVGKAERNGGIGEELVGIYEPTVKKSEIAEDLKAAAP